MSRSYKKTPISKDYNKGEKRLANRKIKSILKKDPDAIGQGGNYKKAYDQWEISDFRFRVTKEHWRKRYYQCLKSGRIHDRLFASKYTIEEWMQIWEKYYRRK